MLKLWCPGTPTLGGQSASSGADRDYPGGGKEPLTTTARAEHGIVQLQASCHLLADCYHRL